MCNYVTYFVEKRKRIECLFKKFNHYRGMIGIREKVLRFETISVII